MSSIHSARHRNESMNMSFEPPSKDIQLAEGGNLLSCKSTNSEEDESIAAVKVIWLNFREIYIVVDQEYKLCHVYSKWESL